MRKVIMAMLVALSLTLGVRAQEVYVDNVVIVLDASGSMDGGMSGTTTRRIDAARVAIREVMKSGCLQVPGSLSLPKNRKTCHSR